MKHLNALIPLIIIASCTQKPEQDRVITPVNFSDVEINDTFWTPVLEKHKDVTIDVCIDQIENKTGRMQNYVNAATKQGPHSGIYFDDSDVYKALEGMAYSLKNIPDQELEAKCDDWISKFAAAQQPDGYLYTFYTINGLENRWTDMGMHEMYCAGHMFEAAVAYYNVTGKKELLDVSERFAQHIMSIFGPGKRDWVTGHEEIELALVKLYEVTGKKEYLEFANWLLEERGHGYYVTNTDYCQNAVPVSELTDISGHAVRLMYLCCGMADVASYTGNQAYMDALNRVWEDVVERNMYITGGIGSCGHNEGFTTDYDLPNKEAYCETCASIGMVLWNWRMNLMSGDSKFADIVEKCLYNGVMSGISLDCGRFFYVNPLESDGNHHRQEWYGCACCPSNVCRFIPSMGNYIYGFSDDNVYVNLYMGSKTEIDGMQIEQKTSYPWSGNVQILIGGSPGRKTLKLRVPGWCENWSVSVNGDAVECATENGYACISRKWKSGDVIDFNMDMPVKMVKADDRVLADVGKRALQRGPVVFCMEGVDNSDIYADALLDSTTAFDVVDGFPSGIVNISAKSAKGEYKFIPYFAWDNREASPMKVWVDFAD